MNREDANRIVELIHYLIVEENNRLSILRECLDLSKLNYHCEQVKRTRERIAELLCNK